MIKCPNCGSLNLKGNNFCGKCGARLPAPKICPNCQLQSFYNDFCTNCGTKLVSQSDFENIKNLMDEALHLWLFDRKYIQAIIKYNRVLQIFPNYIKALDDKAYCFSFLDKYDEAINCYNKILKIDFNNLSAWNGKGDCFKSIYKYDNALDCYNKALKINPNHQSSLKSKAEVLISMRKYVGIHEILSKINPESEYEWANLSRTYRKINDFNNALKCLDNIDDEQWKDTIYLEKSRIFQQLGKYDCILKECNEKLKKDSNNPLALRIKANCLTILKKYDEAINCLDELIEITPEDYSAIFSKVQILLKLEKYEDIKSILSKVCLEYASVLMAMSTYSALSILVPFFNIT